jgi:predicted transcriptional regulator
LDPTSSNRAKIVRLAKVSPGIHLRELERILNLSFHSIRYHVEALTKSGQIICDKESGYSRIYPIGTDRGDMNLYSYLRVKSARSILSALASGGYMSNKEICEKTGLAKSTVSESIQDFIENQIVSLELTQSGVKIRLQNTQHVEELILKLDQISRSRDVVESFVDLWDF